MSNIHRTIVFALAAILCFGSLSAQETIQITEYQINIGDDNHKILVSATGDSLFLNRGFNHQVSNSPMFPRALEVCSITGLIRQGSGVFFSCSCIRTDEEGDEINGFCIPSGTEGTYTVKYFNGTGKYADLVCEQEMSPTDKGQFYPSYFTNAAVSLWEFPCKRN